MENLCWDMETMRNKKNWDSREEQLPSSFFQNNRRKLVKCLEDKIDSKAMVVVFAGAAVHKSADMNYTFQVNKNFYYLTGITQEDSVLVLIVDKSKTSHTLSYETKLFIQPYDAHRERWIGKRLTKEEATDLSEIAREEIFCMTEFEAIISGFLAEPNRMIFLETDHTFGPAKEFAKSVRSLQVEKEQMDLATYFSFLRLRKEACEIETIKKAIVLTHVALDEMLTHVRPDVKELELTTSFQYALARRGCLEPAFESIFAAEENALCLHYLEAKGKVSKGALVQVDVGGEIAGYSADISRVFPADGVFSSQQKQLYEAVLACHYKAMTSIKPGFTLVEINDLVRREAYIQLIKLGLIDGDNPFEEAETTEKINQYYWHNVSHHMGLDVHDIGDRSLVLEKDMVITVEPGIYVPQWGIGFRIEDDVLVLEDGCENLSLAIPRTWQEIESWMEEKRKPTASSS